VKDLNMAGSRLRLNTILVFGDPSLALTRDAASQFCRRSLRMTGVAVAVALPDP
jgi:hypothetical protein